MHQGAPTIVDVARESGFSPMTVSRVINGDKNVREATRAKVRTAIEKLNYSPNLAARTLAGAEQVRIAMIYSNPSAAYLTRFLLGGMEQARRTQAQLVIENCGADEANIIEEITRVLNSGVDGVIVPPPLCDLENVRAILKDSNLPCVLIANWKPPEDFCVVRIDDQAAAADITRHIIELGHQRIGFIIGNPAHKASSQRLMGFKNAMAEAGLQIEDDLIVQGQFDYRSGLEATEKLLNLKQRPTAIFAGNDDMAAAAVSVAHRMHLDVPKDLTICGFDDTDFAQSIWPELTTIHQPIAQMTRTAINMIIEQIRIKRSGREESLEDTILDYTLIKRDSAAPPPQ